MSDEKFVTPLPTTRKVISQQQIKNVVPAGGQYGFQKCMKALIPDNRNENAGERRKLTIGSIIKYESRKLIS
jgi:hypothetical protein